MVFPKSQLFPRIPLPDLSLYLSQGSSHSRIRVNTGRMNTNTVDCIIFFSLENKPSCVGSVNFLKVFNIYYPSFSPMVSFLLPKILFHCFCLKVRNPPNSFASCSKITADGDCSHDIKRCLLLGRKVITNLDSILKSRDITLPTKVHLLKAMVFPVVVYGCESWI